MKRRVAILIVLIPCMVTGLGVAYVRHRENSFQPEADRLILLVPDGAKFSDPGVTVWLDAASEEGLHVVPMHDGSFLSPLSGRPRCAGLILPDSIHTEASDLLVNAIRDYVSAGGKLMLVYDAGTKSQNGYYTAEQSRFSNLAGLNYALYSSLRGGMIQTGSVRGTIPTMNELEVPPGKYFPLGNSPRGDPTPSEDTLNVELRRYQYGDLEYPSFVTSGTYSGQVLLQSRAGVVAGYHSYGAGSVLFVNLPVGYLEGDTDGLPLHAFLQYFARHVLALPYLTPVPDGVGGLVLNWHIDSNAAIKALQQMGTWDILKQGPYSIDITAGPDTYTFGDHRGFDILNNRTSQQLVREYMLLGNEIGSHGGWIHNYFGEHVDTAPQKDMEKFLQLNKDALEHVTGRPVLEYSAPVGNQPQWVTRWLEQHHFVGYYFTGDTGMGPTQGYRKGQRAGDTIWAFPILHLDRAASFEEITTEGYSKATTQSWLEAATDFVVQQRQARLIYFHPPGILGYEHVVHEWLQKTAGLRLRGVFRWYTMTQLGTFLNSRKQVEWKLTEHDQLASLEARGPHTLNHQTWWLPASRFTRPTVVQGAATVMGCDEGWLVVAGDGEHLKVEATLINQ